MRVIAGKARRINLETPDGLDTRPTTDRIKETLFNMINYDLRDSNFLDLFSGSGAIGIEALSRGAANAVFIENGRAAADCILNNLEKTGLKSYAKVIKKDVLTALSTMTNREYGIFNFVFMDPPYGRGFQKRVLELLKNADFINDDTLIIAEESLDSLPDDMLVPGFEIVKVKTYKSNQHIFIKRN